MTESRQDRSVTVLQALDKIGAINLEVLLSRADEVRTSLAEAGLELEPGDICYKFTMHVGPRVFDIVQVAQEFEQLGFKLTRG
jgi:hypothetical protein